MKQLLFIIALFFVASAGFAQKTYMLDKFHSRVGFSVNHFGISNVEGNFKIMEATVEAKKEDLTDATINFTADVNSIDTDVEMRDKDLKSPNYFDAAKYPTITFKSKSFKKVEGKKYKLSGDITIHGVTKPIEFDVLYNGTAVTAMKQPTAGFTITGKINRLDFGVGGPVATGISNEVELKANVEFTING